MKKRDEVDWLKQFTFFTGLTMKPTQRLLKFSQHTTLRTQMTHIDLSTTMYLRGRGESTKALKTYLKEIKW